MLWRKEKEQLEDILRRIDILEYREALREVKRLKENMNSNIPIPPSLMLVIKNFEDKYSANECHAAKGDF